VVDQEWCFSCDNPESFDHCSLRRNPSLSRRVSAHIHDHNKVSAGASQALRIFNPTPESLKNLRAHEPRLKPALMCAQKYEAVGCAGGSARENANFPRGTLTRILCIAGLCASASVSTICIAAGAAYYNKAQYQSQGWLSLNMARALKETLPLLINILVAALTESTGFIHATTLRWALGEKLIFTSNLRLFSRGQGHFAFGRISNFLNAGFLILSYSATSLVLVGLPPDEVCNQPQLNVKSCGDDAVYFCPGALIGLGIGLAGNAALTIWQLSTITVPTWSSSPIDIVWASSSIGQKRRAEKRCMLSVHESMSNSAPRKPKALQQSAWSAHREVRRVLIYLWAIVIAVLIWFGGLAGGISAAWRPCTRQDSYICTVFSGSSWSLLPDTRGLTSFAQIDTVSNTPGVDGSLKITDNEGFAGAFVLIMAFQSILTIGLHCAELLVTLSRDEDEWRETTTRKGQIDRNALLTVTMSWKSVILLALKPIVHWLFGLGMSFYKDWGIFMRPPQLLYLSFAFMALAALGTYLCFSRPKGPQPAAFGHVQTLTNLIDDWNEQLHWGDKGQGIDGIHHAGTANSELPPIIMTEEYAAG